MKKLLIGFALVLSLVVSQRAFAGVWYHGEDTAPSANTVIVDTGPQAAGYYSFTFSAYSTLTGFFKVQQIAANGSTVVHEQRFSVVAGQFTGFGTGSGTTFLLDTDERLRIITTAGIISGVVSASIFLQ